MTKIIVLLMTPFLILGCTSPESDSTKTLLTPQEFQAKISALPSAPIIDVRSPEEFASGHLDKAQNMNWNGSDFDQKISTLTKSEPVLVYCLGGGRSASAAAHMREQGFTTVFELEGGIMNWRSQNLPENNASTSTSKGMSKMDFDSLIVNDKIVLVDFYADWCEPCKRMKPFLDEIALEMVDKVEVIRINADEHPNLCKTLGINALPVVQVYKNKQLSWTHNGYISKKELMGYLN